MIRCWNQYLEQKFLLTCDRDEALIIADQNHVALKVKDPELVEGVVASEKEHPLIITNPAERLVLNV